MNNINVLKSPLCFAYDQLRFYFETDDNIERMRFRFFSSFSNRSSTRLVLPVCPDIISMEDLGMSSHFDRY